MQKKKTNYTRAMYLELAIFKAIGLLPNTQKRVTAENKSYWVFNHKGNLFIGSIDSEPLPPFFEYQTTYILVDRNDKEFATLQKLIIQNFNKNQLQ